MTKKERKIVCDALLLQLCAFMDYENYPEVYANKYVDVIAIERLKDIYLKIAKNDTELLCSTVAFTSAIKQTERHNMQVYYRTRSGN